MSEVFLSTPSARRATRPNEYNLCMLIFLSTPSARRATSAVPVWTPIQQISIHALREEGDGLLIAPTRCLCNFYPRPPRGGRLSLADEIAAAYEFLSTPSARRATCGLCVAQGRRAISIHALREEGDRYHIAQAGTLHDFYPRPPRGGRRGTADVIAEMIQFLSTPSARRATCLVATIWLVLADFYPRPPRGGRQRRLKLRGDFYIFLSTPSARRATYYSQRVGKSAWISIHALREEGDRRPSGHAPGRSDFYPRPPRGGRHDLYAPFGPGEVFLSTPSARRATRTTAFRTTTTPNFYPRPPRGGRPLCGVLGFHGLGISIHALREEGDEQAAAENDGFEISIHALREEGDREQAAKLIRDALFLSTPSARRATAPVIFVNVLDPKFLSTPSARRATDLVRLSGRGWFISIHALREEGDTVSPSEIIVDKEISIHALREEGDVDCIHFLPVDDISIHALREEGDATIFGSFWSASGFLSTPSARRATCRSGLWTLLQVISIHALREEGDLGAQLLHILAHDFYPRPPRGGRPSLGGAAVATAKFLSTPSARRATHLPSDWFPDLRYFYPRPPRGGRRSLQQQRPA